MLRKKDLDRLLMTMLRSQKGTSDLNFTPGKPLQVEASGALTPVTFNPSIDTLTPFQTEMLAQAIIGGDRNSLETLVRSGSTDCAYEVPGECRFRVNIFQQRKQYSAVLRKLETKIMTLDDLGLPDPFREMAAEKNGLILVTGATGSGKSTTLAALLNEMNETRAIHILTIEDPIEFVHPHKKATFNQRELGTDFDTFASSLRAALRQAPKVILIGEMRDRATVEIGLAAASTGHLVLSTLHSIDCGQTINRIIGMFDKDEEAQIRAKLAECLRFVVNQRLLPKEGGGRAASVEIMGMNIRVRELVVGGEQEGKTFYDITGLGRARGWQTHDQALEDLYKDGKISEETAAAYASNRPILMRALDRVKQERGVEDKDALQLSLDTSDKKVSDLIKKVWPPAKTAFPLHQNMAADSRLIIYEPRVINQGGTAQLTFAFKVQGNLMGINAPNPTGELDGTASVNGGDAPMLAYKGTAIKAITVMNAPAPKAVSDRLNLFISQLIPDPIELANPKLTQTKRQALEEISAEGKLQHIQALRNVLGRSTDDEERAALEQAVAAIQERGQ